MSDEAQKPKPRTVIHLAVMEDGNVGIQVESDVTSVADLLLAASFLTQESAWRFQEMRIRQMQAAQTRPSPILRPNGTVVPMKG